MPTIITRGLASAQGYGFGASAQTTAAYIEDVFSTYLYTGTGATQTITNNIDLSTKGGLVWAKCRDYAFKHSLADSATGIHNTLVTNSTAAALASYNPATNDILSFNTDGFSVGSDNAGYYNINAGSMTSWTFRKQPKFFDVVTYTGDGVAGRTVAHNLGSVPGMIIVKLTSASGTNWAVYHRGLNGGVTPEQYGLWLNLTNSILGPSDSLWNNTAPTSSVFSVGTNGAVNTNGATYVAYLFAHDAGGFGAAGTDNVISCGSYTGNGSSQSINLGWEPQYLITRASSAVSNWWIYDNMRGWANGGVDASLNANASSAEDTSNVNILHPNATGFTLPSATFNANGTTYIYMAIRRGPMKTPTDATKVFSPSYAVGGFPSYVTNFVADFNIDGSSYGSDKFYAVSRLTGTRWLNTSNTNAEGTSSAFKWDSNNGCITGRPTTYIGWTFARAPGFFDEVCYTGTGVARSINHNLGVVPELWIVKQRSGGTATTGWAVGGTIFSSNTGGTIGSYFYINTDQALVSLAINAWATPTSTTFGIGTQYPNDNTWNYNGATYVAYLFATCPGVSKVGSYTGTGAAQNIDCGFSASARFILIKRTDSSGDWYVYDSARGISSSTNDPYLFLNTTAAEVTNTDYVGTYASGFSLTATAPAALNANGGSFIFLAVA